MSIRRWMWRAALLGLSFFPLQSAFADHFERVPPHCPLAPHCPPVQGLPPSVVPIDPTQPGQPVQPMPPADPTQPAQPEQPEQPPQPSDPVAEPTPDVDLSGLAFGATGEGAAEVSAPNMFGNLLNANRSVSFFVNRITGDGFLQDTGFTNIINNKIAENNSPIPRDRIGYRFNHFHNGVTVRGLSPQPPTFDPIFLGNIESSLSRSTHVEMHTFDAEKTFFNGLASVQLRVPFASALTSDLNLQFGRIIGSSQATFIGPGGGRGAPAFFEPDDPFNVDAVASRSDAALQAFNVQRTPGDTFGNQTTQFGNLSLILKGLLYTDCRWAVSGGMSVLIPTGQDTNVRVTDYLGDSRLNNAEIQRVREFRIDNETWALSPFVAAVLTPNPNWFVQGFMQFDFPLNESDVEFRETFPNINNRFATVLPNPAAFGLGIPPGGRIPPFTDRASLEEQTLMHVDIGGGYFLRRDPGAPVITAIVPMIELHYTTALESADIVTLQPDIAFAFPRRPDGGLDPNTLVPAPAPQVGNFRNRVDILDLTVGTTFGIGSRATVGVAFSFPLMDDDNRTFDWEGQVQLNYFFGGGGFIPPGYQ